MKKKALICLMTAVLCFGMTACGESSEETAPADQTATEASDTAGDTTDAADSETTDASADDASADASTDDAAASSDFSMDGAEEQTWGAYTVSVPSGWEFKKGDALDEKDERYCSVSKSFITFFDFKMEDEDVAKQQYEYNKNTYTNEQSDVSGKIGDIDWVGFQYSDGLGGYGFELIGQTASGKPIRVSCSGFKFDSPETNAILGSLKAE